jgi:hypothetical protein
VAVALSIATIGGCTALLAPDDQCRVDGDCQSSALVCRGGLCVRAEDAGPAGAEGPYLLSYFVSDRTLAGDSLHLAYGSDGLHWTALANGLPVYTVPSLGSRHIRDPFILRREDGTFVLLATDWTLAQNDADYWSHPSSSIFVAETTDLITFTNPRLLELTTLPGPNGERMHAWAPEAYFDEERGAYAILWSGNDATGRNRIYVTYTIDFTSLVNEIPEIYFDPGYAVIDATLVRTQTRSYLFFKDESDGDGGPLTGTGKDIQIARTPAPTVAPGSFSREDGDYLTRGVTQGVRRLTESPLVFNVPNEQIWFLCANFFVYGGIGCWRGADLDAPASTWTEIAASQFRFPANASQPSIVRVTQGELDALLLRYGATGVFRVRTSTLLEGAPTYLAHSYYHAMLTTLDDRTHGQLAEDFLWRIVPGLADPGDPDLVSFESAIRPGHFLRIDSANPSRYPPCPEASNRNTEACTSVPPGERVHLGWLDGLEETPTFRSDATFRRVPSQNGARAMVSFQWHGNPSLYLRSMALQMFVKTVDASGTQRDEASFALEPQ